MKVINLAQIINEDAKGCHNRAHYNIGKTTTLGSYGYIYIHYRLKAVDTVGKLRVKAVD